MVQYVGLSPRALSLVTIEPILTHTDHIIRKFPDGKEQRLVVPVYANPIVVRTGNKEFYSDFLDNPCYLDEYVFPDGKIYFETVQEIYWSSGPMIFTAFKDEVGNFIEDSRWTAEELNACI